MTLKPPLQSPGPPDLRYRPLRHPLTLQYIFRSWSLAWPELQDAPNHFTERPALSIAHCAAFLTPSRALDRVPKSLFKSPRLPALCRPTVGDETLTLSIPDLPPFGRLGAYGIDLVCRGIVRLWEEDIEEWPDAHDFPNDTAEAPNVERIRQRDRLLEARFGWTCLERRKRLQSTLSSRCEGRAKIGEQKLGFLVG